MHKIFSQLSILEILEIWGAQSTGNIKVESKKIKKEWTGAEFKNIYLITIEKWRISILPGVYKSK